LFSASTRGTLASSTNGQASGVRATVTEPSRLRDQVIDPEVATAIDRVAADRRANPLGYDPWGFRPDAAKLYYSLAKRIYQYFRPHVVGIEALPAGRLLIVPNHSGQLPFDALTVAVACLLEAEPPRLVRAMAERWFPTLPFVNVAFSRSGVVLGDPLNCKNLLEAEQTILVFPEGTRGSGKTFWRRYQLARFGRGFVRLALQTDTPVVPVGIVGAEESLISVANFKPLADLLRMPYMPVPALLPLLGPLAFLPLPTRFHLHFGEPIHLTGPFDDEDEAIDAKVAVVEQAVRDLLARGRAERQSWFG
jgi:1-acyl-sn-glycerol-3-phosphate acyltransferase